MEITDGDVNQASPSNVVEFFDGPSNPLLIDVILRTLFAYVKPNDLKRCRLVCADWNVITVPFVRSSFEVTILSDESFGNLDLDLDPRTPRMTDFVKLFESNTLGVPFAKFNLGPFDPTVGIGEKFLQLCEETAKKFDFWKTKEIHAVENIAVLLRSAPKLESLTVPFQLSSKHGVNGVKLFSGNEVVALKNLKTLCFGKGNIRGKELICPTFYEEILSTAENISTLSTRYYEYRREDIGSLEVLNILENLGRTSFLENLSLFSVNEEYLEVLRKMSLKPKPNGLKLKHLRIYNGTREHAFWLELIEMMKDSLISLDINHSGPFPQKFPRMPNLQLLELRFWKGQENSLEDLNYNFPSLQNLGLCISVDQFSIGTECCPMIKSLRIRSLHNMNAQVFERTIKVCPNLTELEVNITQDGSDILRMIWIQTHRLEKLNIYGKLPSDNNLDSMFTGILDEGKKTVITKKFMGLKRMTSEVRNQTIPKLIDDYRTLPSIGNLTRLRQLTLNVTTWRGRQSHLTDMTGYLGLYCLKNLRSLNVSLCKFSKSCSQILVEDLGLESWVVQRNAQSNIITPKLKPEDLREFPSSKFSFNYTI